MSQDFSSRLQQWEASPPKDHWPEIEARLKSAAWEGLGERLRATEVQPPTEAWSTIADRCHPTPIRSMSTPHNRTIPLYARPFAVAAAMIAFFVGGMWYHQVSPFDPSPLMQKSLNVSTYTPKTTSAVYVPYQSPGGQPIKISKRIHEFLKQSTPPTESKKQPAPSDARLEQWRAQILQSNFIPSPDNFMSILELQEMLAEKQGIHGQN